MTEAFNSYDSAWKNYRSRVNKKVVLMAAALAFLVMSGILFWPDKRPALQFIGYKWNPTNRIWYAEMSLVNNASKSIWLKEYHDSENNGYRPLGLLYHLQATNLDGTYRILDEHWTGKSFVCTAKEVKPGEKFDFLAKIFFSMQEGFLNIDQEVVMSGRNRMMPMNTMISGTYPINIGVQCLESTNNSRSFFLEKIRQGERLLGMKTTLKDDYAATGLFCWCETILNYPTNSPIPYAIR